MGMEDVRRFQRQRRYQTYQICDRIIKCVQAKIRMAMSCSVHRVTYAFRLINFHSCPMLTFKRAQKIKRYVERQLKKEGFNVLDVTTCTENESDILWTLCISW
jgi:hypothetical protein